MSSPDRNSSSSGGGRPARRRIRRRADAQNNNETPRRTRRQAAAGSSEGEDADARAADARDASITGGPGHTEEGDTGSRAGSQGTRERDESRLTSERQSEEDDEGEGEELIGEDMYRDYERRELLDTYDENLLDEREHRPLTYEERRAAENAMGDRDRRTGKRRVPMAFEESSEGSGLGETRQERTKRMRRMEHATLSEIDMQQDQYEEFNLEHFDVPLSQWVAQEQTQQEIKRRFKHFLNSFQDSSGHFVYSTLIDRMCADNRQSLEVSYMHLSQDQATLAIWLADIPKTMLKIFDEVAKGVVLSKFPDYSAMHDEIHVRITDLPIADSLRDLRHVHLNVLVKVSGVVTRRTGVFPQLRVARYTCLKCGSVSQPYVQNNESETKAGSCIVCQSTGPFSLNSEQTIYRNYQKITLQESPGSVSAGRVPRYKDVILLADLIDAARPGEEIEVTGILTNTFDASLNTRQGFPVFSTVLEANFVEKKQDVMASHHLTQEDIEQIEALSREPGIGDRIVKSLAPSIYGHEHIKRAVCMSIFGGVEKNLHNKHRVRGDINVLLMGDPGTAKSQVLKYVEKTAPRAVYTTGKGASAVGLTAAVHRDTLTGEWTLEGGALVLADRGTCLIDEFDKMNDQDRTSIHEAMEQQSISISKAGIVTTLQARCGVIAAANPVGGRYDPSKTFAENVHLTDPILQRFDVLCVLQDQVDPVGDEKLANFVVQSHQRSHPGEANARDENNEPINKYEFEDGTEPIPQTLLKKYIIYARNHRNPQFTNVNIDKISKLYWELRKESEISNGIPIAVRHIESIVRMAEANARMHLRSLVTEEDVNIALRVMLESFIQAQKYAVMRNLRSRFSSYLEYKKDQNQLLLFKLREITREAQAAASVALSRRARELVAAEEQEGDETPALGKVTVREGVNWEEGRSGPPQVTIKLDALREKAKRHGITEISQQFFDSDDLKRSGYHYDRRRKEFVKQFG